jgi:hypothetical protein
MPKLLVLIIVSLFSCSAVADGQRSVGIVTWTSNPEAKFFTSFLDDVNRRADRGMEYALDNAELKNQLVNVAIKLTLGAANKKDAGAVAVSLRNQISRINLANKKGVDLQFVHKAVAEIVEIALVKARPELNAPLTAAKVVSAFAAAYAYGFMFGE